MRFNDDGMPSGIPEMLAALGVTLCLLLPCLHGIGPLAAPLWLAAIV